MKTSTNNARQNAIQVLSTKTDVNIRTKLADAIFTQKYEMHKDVRSAILGARVNWRELKIYPKKWVGGGGHIRLQDYSFHVSQVLKLQGYKIETGNDAPRGGKDGDYFKLSKKGMDYFLKLREVAIEIYRR